MRTEEHIVSYTADEIRAKRARGEDQTDWARVDALTDEEIEASIDWQEEGIPDPDTRRTSTVWHEQDVTLPLDDTVVAWFRAAVAGTGIGYKTRIAEVLRDYVATQHASTANDPNPGAADPAPADPACLTRRAS